MAVFFLGSSWILLSVAQNMFDHWGLANSAVRSSGTTKTFALSMFGGSRNHLVPTWVHFALWWGQTSATPLLLGAPPVMGIGPPCLEKRLASKPFGPIHWSMGPPTSVGAKPETCPFGMLFHLTLTVSSNSGSLEENKSSKMSVVKSVPLHGVS